MALGHKGQLAYKDPSGNVWNIDVNSVGEWVARNSEGEIASSEFIDELLQVLDDSPEWAKLPPSESLQMEQLDRGAFPDASN